MADAHIYAECLDDVPPDDYWHREQAGIGSAGWPDATIQDEQPLVDTRLPKGMWAHHMDVLTLDNGSRIYAKSVGETDDGVLTGHLLADALLDQLDVDAPEMVYDIARDEVWVEEVADARLPTSYPRFRSCPADIDTESFYDAVATKLLLGDTDIGKGGTVENVLVSNETYCVPLDFDKAGNTLEEAYRRIGGANTLARHLDIPFSYDRLDDHAAYLAEQVDMRAFLHDVYDSTYLTLDDPAPGNVIENVRIARDGLPDALYRRTGGWPPW